MRGWVDLFMRRYLPLSLFVCLNWGQCDFNSDGYINIFDICATVDCIFADCWDEENLFTPQSSIIFKDIPGGTFTMGESESSYRGPPGGYDSYLHKVILNSFQIS